MNFFNSSTTYNAGDDGLIFAVRLGNNAFDFTQVSAAYFEISGEDYQRNFTYIDADY